MKLKMTISPMLGGLYELVFIDVKAKMPLCSMYFGCRIMAFKLRFTLTKLSFSFL